MKSIALIGIAMLLTACATTPRAPLPQQFVFASARSGNGDIYIAGVDGSGLRRLTSDPAPDQLPRCAPDGRSIVFVRGDGPQAELYRLDLLDGSETRLTSNTVRDSTPHWSPDGRQIYFTRRDGAHDRIAVMNADGAQVRFLTDGKAHDTMPAVSPDGRSLVHHTYRYGREGTELHRIDLATGTSHRLTALAGNDYEAAFAGNGWIVFSTNTNGTHFMLFVLEVETHSVHLLADTGMDAWGARYSPVTRQVLFYTGTRDAWRMMRVPFEGGQVQPVLEDGHSNRMPDWC